MQGYSAAVIETLADSHRELQVTTCSRTLQVTNGKQLQQHQTVTQSCTVKENRNQWMIWMAIYIVDHKLTN